jgi:hypothetical protein
MRYPQGLKPLGLPALYSTAFFVLHPMGVDD